MAVARGATNSPAVLGPVAAARPRLGKPCSRPGRINLSAVVLAQYDRPGAAAFASGAKALEAVSCQTIIQLQTPEDLQLVLQANDLVAENFYSTSSNLLLDAVSFNSYRVRSAGQTLGLHMGASRSHATILALLNGPGPQQHNAAAERAVGVVNVTLMQASESISAVASCKPGTPFAMITNMAVTQSMRRRGIAHQLMQAAIRTSILQLDYSPAFALLLAYKYYQPAIRLYEQWGFEATSWEDPLWKQDAEKGKLGRQRRIMMVKQLSVQALAASPWQSNG
ncbi:hypothetical protein COO60DRAFT_1627213 [Scenedesmus sp. NREL 46B-D3]|nr:hypothetical protein COO60DRAFT_1627213 [Scenedesmus sp. NREL 46B-D3]